MRIHQWYHHILDFELLMTVNLINIYIYIPSGKLTWLLKIAIEILDVPIKHGDFPVRYVSHYQRVHIFLQVTP